MSAGRRRTVLSIAGSDPSGGAGIQADLETFAAIGVRGCAAIAALTAQNDNGVSGVFAVPPAFVVEQIEAVFSGGPVDAVKIGMLANAATVRAVASALKRLGAKNIVVDPVLRASSGAALLDDEGLAALRDELLPIATVVTPNAAEAAALVGGVAPTSLAEMHEVGRQLSQRGALWSLVTGGHVVLVDDCIDVLSNRDGKTVELRVPRTSGGIRGSGCRLSSAIAAHLARGVSVPDACARGQRYVAELIEHTCHPERSAKRAVEGSRVDGFDGEDGIAPLESPSAPFGFDRSLDSLRSLGMTIKEAGLPGMTIKEAGLPGMTIEEARSLGMTIRETPALGMTIHETPALGNPETPGEASGTTVLPIFTRAPRIVS